jgi:hypothetical protein
MSEQQLRKLIEHASGFAEEAMRRLGEVAPIWHMLTRNGEEIVELMPPCESKDDAVALIRALMAIKDVVRYVYFAEAWFLDLRGADNLGAARKAAREAYEKGIADHPDRIEVVTFQGEDAESGRSMTGQRRIIREKGRPYLGPLEFFETTQSEGRMVGMLPKPKGRLQ